MTKEHEIKPTFWQLFWLFLKISIFSFGGGNAMFPMIRNYCVERYKWITDQDIDDILIVTNSLPGASAVEAIVYICYKLLNSKWKAGLVTTLALLPHTVLFFVVFYLGTKYIPPQYLKVIYVAVIPIIIALLLNMTIRYIKREDKSISLTIHWLIIVVTLAFSVFVPVPWCMPILIIVFLIICMLIYKWFKNKKIKNTEREEQ